MIVARRCLALKTSNKGSSKMKSSKQRPIKLSQRSQRWTELKKTSPRAPCRRIRSRTSRATVAPTPYRTWIVRGAYTKWYMSSTGAKLTLKDLQIQDHKEIFQSVLRLLAPNLIRTRVFRIHSSRFKTLPEFKMAKRINQGNPTGITTKSQSKPRICRWSIGGSAASHLQKIKLSKRRSPIIFSKWWINTLTTNQHDQTPIRSEKGLILDDLICKIYRIDLIKISENIFCV